MIRTGTLGLAGALSLLSGYAYAQQAAPQQRALLDKYCVGCHNQRAKIADLMLDKADVNNVPAGAEIWEKVIRKVRGGMMPPAGMPRPDKAATDGLLSYLETSLDRAAAGKPNPGRALVHRLNRTEYGNAVRDLLGLEVDVTSLLPPDDAAYGFDNIADLLGVSPVLLERYLSAAWKISSLAVGDPKTNAAVQTYRLPPELSQYNHIDGLPVGTRGGTVITHNFPLDAEYVLHAGLWSNTTHWVKGIEYANEFVVLLDDKVIHRVTVGGGEDQKLMYATSEADKTFEKRMEVRLPVKAGPHKVGFTFVEKNHGVWDDLVKPVMKDNIDQLGTTGMMVLDKVTVAGPFNPKGSGDTPSRRHIFVCRPAAGADEVPCAKKIITALARKAYRTPVNDAQVETLLGFFQKGRNEGDFDAGVEYVVTRILASPEYLFRLEPDPANVKPDTPYRVSDFELASRLAFFLWSSIPDEPLLNLAAQGKLKDPTVFEQQARRMMTDPRSDALITNFAGQWLYLRNLKDTHPDQNQFPDFDENLRDAMRKETELFFGSILREDRSVLDLLNANYTFLNERMARHYGIPNIYGEHFRRVTVTEEARKGLLGQASFLTVSSYPNRTSPVLRGKFILTNLLGTPPPPPPPNVPPLKDDQPGQPLTMKQKMEQHRANAACAVCHRVMDPIGFTLENFDAVGEWRTQDHGVSIDPSDVLSDGTKVSGVVNLRQMLLARPDQFVSTLTEKLLTYALGRGVEYYDMPTVRGIAREAARNNYRFSSLLLGIVKSVPFQMKIKKAQELESQTVAAVGSGRTDLTSAQAKANINNR
jgi:mono/diheme cytochrome c family protein